MYKLLSNLHHVNARRINTFQVGTMLQDPIQVLQNSRSFDKYVEHFQAAVCYFVRVVEQDYFKQEMFTVTTAQRVAFNQMVRVTDELLADNSLAPLTHRSARPTDDEDEEYVHVPDDATSNSRADNNSY